MPNPGSVHTSPHGGAIVCYSRIARVQLEQRRALICCIRLPVCSGIVSSGRSIYATMLS